MDADPLIGKVLDDRFELLERIGEGGVFVVYRATQVRLDREVAVKVLGAHVASDESWIRRVHRAASAMSRLRHPQLTPIHDFGQSPEGLIYVVRELREGIDLRDEIDRQPIDPARALRIITSVCAPLAAVHAAGMIHRDLRPDQIGLVDDPMAGLRAHLHLGTFIYVPSSDEVTRPGLVFGTPMYMSPEQGRGAALAPTSDIYALGVVLYEMLTARAPFDGATPTDVVMKHLRDAPPPLDAVPGAVSDLVMRMLAKDPANRPQRCEQLAADCAFVERALAVDLETRR